MQKTIQKENVDFTIQNRTLCSTTNPKTDDTILSLNDYKNSKNEI